VPKAQMAFTKVLQEALTGPFDYHLCYKLVTVSAQARVEINLNGDNEITITIKY
jgi:hypothetical protein